MTNLKAPFSWFPRTECFVIDLKRSSRNYTDPPELDQYYSFLNKNTY